MKLGVDSWVTSGKYKLPFRSEGERESVGGRGEGRDIALHLFGVDTKNVPPPLFPGPSAVAVRHKASGQ